MQGVIWIFYIYMKLPMKEDAEQHGQGWSWPESVIEQENQDDYVD